MELYEITNTNIYLWLNKSTFIWKLWENYSKIYVLKLSKDWTPRRQKFMIKREAPLTKGMWLGNFYMFI